VDGLVEPATRPSSNSIMKATLVIGLVIGIDAKNGVVLDRRLCARRRQSPAPALWTTLAAAVHQQLRSRKAAGIDVAVLQMRFDTVEGGLGHTADSGEAGVGANIGSSPELSGYV